MDRVEQGRIAFYIDDLSRVRRPGWTGVQIDHNITGHEVICKGLVGQGKIAEVCRNNVNIPVQGLDHGLSTLIPDRAIKCDKSAVRGHRWAKFIRIAFCQVKRRSPALAR